MSFRYLRKPLRFRFLRDPGGARRVSGLTSALLLVSSPPRLPVSFGEEPLQILIGEGKQFHIEGTGKRNPGICVQHCYVSAVLPKRSLLM